MSIAATITLSSAPPSLNQAFRNAPGKGRILTAKYAAWAKAAGWEVQAQMVGRSRPVVSGAYGLVIEVGHHASRADLDNLIKPVSDLLVGLKITPDDSWATEFSIRRAEREGVRVMITDTTTHPAVPDTPALDYFRINTTLCRRAPGETQQSVADALGVTRQNISQFEADTRRMSLDLACRLARIKGFRLRLEPIPEEPGAAKTTQGGAQS